MKFLLASLLLPSTTTAFTSPRNNNRALIRPLYASGGALHIRPVGIGSASPVTTITNVDLESVHDTSDEWIRTRTGIERRNVLVHDGTRKVVGSDNDEELLEKENLRSLGIDGTCFVTFEDRSLIDMILCHFLQFINVVEFHVYVERLICLGVKQWII